MRGVIQNSVRPIAVYVIDIQTDRVVSDAIITQPSGVFDLGPLQPAAYAVVFRVSFDPQFPLDYVEAVAPSVAVVQDTDFGGIALTFSNDYTVFSGIVDAYLGLTDLDNLDNLDNLSTVNSFNNRQYGSTPRDVHSMDANTSSSTPYGAGGIW